MPRVLCASIPILLMISASCLGSDMEWVRVAHSNDSFELSESGDKFIPWGFNYDHDRDSQLLEDYWHDDWETVEADFAEMKSLGANVVRIHLQFGKFMVDASTARREALDQLAQLVELAEQTGLYLDLTGLGCYHKQDVPQWYDLLSESERWSAQAVFWEAVAQTCSESPAIFCYDLMNEPVVAGGNKKRDDWLGPGFGDKHFVQFITLQRGGRERTDIAVDWIRKLRTAIRKHDQRHLITTGLVDWSLDRPGLTSGFVPEKIAAELDFLAVHIYPKSGAVDEAVNTARAFAAVGKPVVVEETFPLKCSASELESFMEQAQEDVSGWIGFYWGVTPLELREVDTLPAAITLEWLELFKCRSKTQTVCYRSVACGGKYAHHLQGICVCDDSIFWSFTTTLVKTDLRGNVTQTVPVANHHGDLCYHDGQLFVAVNLGEFNNPDGKADSWIYVYDASNLKEVSRHETQAVFHGAGGIGYHSGKFYVVGGLPGDIQENYVYEFDDEFRFLKKHRIKSGQTHLGIQTATFASGKWYFGCYGTPKILLVTDSEFKLLGRFEFDCSLGIVELPNQRLFSAQGSCDKTLGCSGNVTIALPSSSTGLQYVGTNGSSDR